LVVLLVLGSLVFVVDPIETKDRLSGLRLNVEELRGTIGGSFKFFEEKFFTNKAKIEIVQAPLKFEPAAELSPEPQGQSPSNSNHEPLASAKQAEPASPPGLVESDHPVKVKSSTTFDSQPPVRVKGVVRDQRQERPMVIQYGSTIGGIASDVYGGNRLLAMDLLKEANPQIKNLNWVLAGQSLSLPPLSRETLLRKHSDGSYRLILASFTSSDGAEKLGEAVRLKGYGVVIASRKVADNLSLHRVEIGGLKNFEAANQAWETATANRWISVADSPSGRRTNE
jgi:hypothetical protein